jgi:hypothetical protein
LAPGQEPEAEERGAADQRRSEEQVPLEIHR